MSQAERSPQMPAADDPSANPELLPPRTRADVVQDRPAGGSAEEVAAANPALASAVPATVGKADEPGTGVDALLEAADAAVSPSGAGGSGGRREGDAAPQGVGEEMGGAAAAGVGGGGVGAIDMTDGSGMEVPELAVQQGWTH